ncbi:MAG: DUF2156 domain-containing protein [Bacteroidales bacterium]|nr:DUF2156 domain-containing protein [Bacteroidales bacterium]
MIQFKEIELADREWVKPLLAISDFRGTEYCFTSLYMWSSIYHTRIAKLDEMVLIRSTDEQYAYYLYPAGKIDLPKAVELMMEDARNLGKKFAFNSLTESNKEEIEKTFPQQFEFTPTRNNFDYIYHREALATLSGKKYQPKRNFISRFKELPNWSYESISHTDIEKCQKQLEECYRMNEKWCRMNACSHNASKNQECCAVRKVLRDFIALELEGGILKMGEEVIAYTIGEPLSSDTYIVHIEKAFANIKGAYPMINQSFVLDRTEQFSYINREDDAGDEGLRKAKLSYNPAFLIEKYFAIPK